MTRESENSEPERSLPSPLRLYAVEGQERRRAAARRRLVAERDKGAKTMVSKMIEVRDSGTFIPALAVRLGSRVEAERWLLASAGYGLTFEDQAEYVVLCKVNGGEPCACHVDPFAWGQSPSTMLVAHLYLLNRHGELAEWLSPLVPCPKHGGFDAIPEGAVVDVEYVVGLRETPKESEAVPSSGT